MMCSAFRPSSLSKVNHFPVWNDISIATPFLKGVESPSNNSMIIWPYRSQWFFSWRASKGGGGMRGGSRKILQSISGNSSCMPIRIQNIATFNHQACYLELWWSPVKMGRRFSLIIGDEWRLTKTLHTRWSKNANWNAVTAPRHRLKTPKRKWLRYNSWSIKYKQWAAQTKKP